MINQHIQESIITPKAKRGNQSRNSNSGRKTKTTKNKNRSPLSSPSTNSSGRSSSKRSGSPSSKRYNSSSSKRSGSPSGNRSSSRSNEKDSNRHSSKTTPQFNKSNRSKIVKRKRDPSPRKKSNVENGAILEGKVSLHPNGFGFFIPDDPQLDHLYVNQEELNAVMNNDRIKIRAVVGDNFSKAQVLEIISRGQKEFLALLKIANGFPLVIPLNSSDRKHAFALSSNGMKQAEKLVDGDCLLCSVISYPKTDVNDPPPTVDIVKVIEDPDAASQDTLKVIMEAGWPRQFCPEALSEADQVSKNWEKKVATPHVRQLTHLPFVTIDGRDAKDFDDAVLAQHEGSKQLRLWVAIADVSLFVKPESLLDKQAFERATSVYLPDKVIPMLPEVLSNGVCSLKPDEDRPAMVCEMLLNQNGKCEKYEFYEAVIKSHKRLTYEKMQGFMDGEDWAIEECKSVAKNLKALEDTYRVLAKARKGRGTLELDIEEAQVILEKDGTVEDIVVRQRSDSHRLIEECMLKANECCANFMHESKSVGVYRIHETPDPEKLTKLYEFILLCGLNLQNVFHNPEELEDISKLNDILTHAKEELKPTDPQLKILENLTLRAMQQARYSTERMGHFALNLMDYSHFTSPIRRYPDLMAHRLIKNILNIEKYDPPEDFVEGQAMHSSKQERTAVDMERKVVDIKKVRFMERHLGQNFRAWVSGINDKGLFCRLEGHFVDGFIPRDSLNSKGRFDYLEAEMCYLGPRRLRLQLGSPVEVCLAKLNVEGRKIDFELVDPWPS